MGVLILTDKGIVNLSEFSTSSSSVTVTWDSYVSNDNFKVEYQLIKTDQCKDETGNRVLAYVGTEKTHTISRLSAYSTYSIFVSSSGSWPPCVSDEETVNVVTEESGM